MRARRRGKGGQEDARDRRGFKAAGIIHEREKMQRGPAEMLGRSPCLAYAAHFAATPVVVVFGL